MFLAPGLGTVVLQLINFAIFFAILNVLFLRPVGRAIAKRRAYIESLTEDYDRYQAEATALRAEAQGIRATARRDAQQLVGRARAAASDESAEIAAQYAGRVQEIVHDAHRTAAGELAAARAEETALGRSLADAVIERALPELVR